VALPAGRWSRGTAANVERVFQLEGESELSRERRFRSVER
jgi:hypothetical protein